MSDWLSITGNISSTIGIIITMITLFAVFNLRNKFIFNTNIIKNSDYIVSLAGTLSSLLSNYENNENEINEHLLIVDVTLRKMSKGANGDLLKDIKKARENISSFTKAYRFNKLFIKPTKKLAREIRSDLNIIIEELKYVKEDILIGR